MSTLVNTLTGVVKGQFGIITTLTMVDDDGVAINISSYTTKTVHFRSPDSRKTISVNAAFTTDGINGKLDIEFADGDIDRAGTWEGTIELEKTGERLLSKIFTMEVEPRVGT
jgi:hypothetical protein